MALTYQSITTSTTGTCNKPPSTASGDHLAAVVYGVGNTTAASLAGWTSRLAINDGSFSSLTVLTKVAGGSEPANYTFTGPALVDASLIVRATGTGGTLTVDGTASFNTTTSSPAAIPSLTTAIANSLLLMVATNGYSGSPPDITQPGTATEIAEFKSGNGFVILEAAYEVKATAGATGTRSFTSANAASFGMGVMIALNEAASDTPVALDDSGTITGTDALTVDAALSVADSGTITAADALAVDAALPLSDSGTITGTDALAVDAAAVLADAGTLTGTDALTVAADAALSEARTITGADALTIAADAPLTDAGTITGDDALTVTADAAMSDSGTIGVTETLSISLIVPVSMSDAGTISVSESLSIVTRTIPRIGGLLRTGPGLPLVLSRQASAAPLLLNRAVSDAPLVLARTSSAAPIAVSRSESPAPLRVDRTGPGTPIEVTRISHAADVAVIRSEGEL